MKHDKGAKERFNRLLFKITAPGVVSRLDRTDEEGCRLLANALRGALRDDANPEEITWIKRIESLRTLMSSSQEEIAVVDYGAGRKHFHHTEKQMDQGRRITKRVGTVCRRASKSYFWSFLLFKLIREFEPSNCLELGTCLGISASYQAAALKLNQKGSIVTLEGSESLASIAQRNFQTLGVDNIGVVIGRFKDTLASVLKERRHIDYAFIDGHHDEKATWTYFEQIYSYLSDPAVLVFDDIRFSEGMQRTWKRIEQDQRVRISIDMRKVAICIVDRTIRRKRTFAIVTT